MGLALVGVRGYLNTLNEILVFDLSLATGLYALTIYAGVVMGIPASWYQPKHFRRQQRSGARRIGLERLLG